MKNNTYKNALLIALGLASVSAVRASAQDILLGFNDAAGPASAQNDYVIDLGLTGSQLLADAAANNGTYNLSSTFSSSTFATAYGSDQNAGNDVAAGVVGAVSGNPEYIFESSPAGNTPPTITSGEFADVYSDVQVPSLVGEYGSTTSGGWSEYVAVSPTSPGSDEATTGDNVTSWSNNNPLGQLNDGVLTLNLWENSETKSGLKATVGGWVDEGTIDINVNTGSISFATVAVPEPSTYGLVAGAGLLAVAIRRKSNSKNSTLKKI